MFEAFAKAGRGFQSQEESQVYDKLDQLQWDVMMDPTNKVKIELCDEAEAALLADNDFTTASDRGEQQVEFLKALDFDDIVVKGWRVYNLCRAKTRNGGTKSCGLYFFLGSSDGAQISRNGSSFVCWIGMSFVNTKKTKTVLGGLGI